MLGGWPELRWTPALSREPLRPSSIMDLTHLVELSSSLDVQTPAALWS